MNLTFISYAIAAALGFGAAWTLQGRAIDSLKLEQKDERIARDYASRAAIERNTSAVFKAQNGAVVLAGKSRADADSARTELDRLQHQSAETLRTAAASLDACLVAANSFRVVFDQCSTSYESLAGNAQRHTDDIKTLVAGWPKN